MNDKQIFISCGQSTEDEKKIGGVVKRTVDETEGFRGYFADKVQDLDGLGINVFESIRQSSGAIIVLHSRGLVESANGQKWGPRSSVWINQEIAILAYRQFFESKRLPILAFKDNEVKIEGAMSSLIINPELIPQQDELEQRVKEWLAEKVFPESSTEFFREIYNQLDFDTISVISGIIDGGGKNVNVSTIKMRLTARYGMNSGTASDAIRKAKLVFQTTSLVHLVRNPLTGMEMSLHPTWEWDLRREIAAWLKHRHSSV